MLITEFTDMNRYISIFIVDTSVDKKDSIIVIHNISNSVCTKCPNDHSRKVEE